MLGKSKKIINVIIEDYVIRMIGTAGNSLSSIRLLEERPIPVGLIENGKIIDEIGFFEFMKVMVKELGIKNQQVRFYVPNPIVIMREVEFPFGLAEKDMFEYFEMEIGKSIQFPFKDAIFDVNPHHSSGGKGEEMQKGTIFAAPKEEIVKYTEIFADVSLKPIAADVKALGIYRYFHYIYNLNKAHVYLFAQLNITSLTLSIFNNHQLEFMRYQELDIHITESQVDEEVGDIYWQCEEDEDSQLAILEDQILELERVMNFYRFSMKKGEEMVSEIVLLGDHPLIKEFHQKLSSQFELQPSKILKGYLSSAKDREIGIQFIPALGLALKGGITTDDT